MMEGRQIYQYRSGSPLLPVTEAQPELGIFTAAPILTEGDVMGCVVFTGNGDSQPMGETEYKLAQTISSFLGRHMEN
jgi:AbrB family transcriptional regulator (stage V sporulation protein T)